ncbi:MAG: exopolysaccharide biosynthesis polyprenyl glycosylphosphotransferase [Caulobacter sp.]|nr:exopolysaccharide biosynthesis polyprenyl glycosylphosphotransferase [Caulobacter sp.]
MKIATAPRDEPTGPSETGRAEAVRALHEMLDARFGPESTPVAKDRRPERRGPFRPARLTPVRSRLELGQVTGAYRALDSALVIILAVVAAQIHATQGLFSAPLGALLPLVLGTAVLIWSLPVLRSYGFGRRETMARHLIRVCAAFGLTGLGLAASLVLLPQGREAAPAAMAWFVMSLGGLVLTHGLWWSIVSGWRREGRLTPNIVIVGATESARKLIETALKTQEVAVLGVFDDRLGRAPKDIAGVPVLGDTGDLLGHRIMPYVDRIVIAVTASAQPRIRQLIDRLRVLPNEVSLVIEAGGEDGRQRALSRIADAQLAQVSGEPANIRRAGVKRAQDLVVASLALLLGWPIMVAVAVAVRLDSPGPIFFRQRRHGFNNEEILVWKFRSMRAEAADFAAVQQVRAGDDRVTRVGGFIRKTSLDELPQLFNVLLGEMSLVGPRPHAVGMKTGQTESARLVAEYAHRHRMKPGMTGWAAIHGSRGPVDTPELVRRRVALDIEYIERQSFWLDLYVMAMTIPCLLGDRDQVR